LSNNDRSTANAALLAALASGGSHKAAAELAGVSTKTIQRRLKDPEFRRLVEDGLGSLTRMVLAGVPLLFHSSSPPWLPSAASKSSVPLTFVRKLAGHCLGAPPVPPLRAACPRAPKRWHTSVHVRLLLEQACAG
jgi:hypothetical protein